MVATAAAAGRSFVKVTCMLRVWQRDGCNFYSCNQMGTGPRFSFSTPWQDKLNDANPRHKKQISVFPEFKSIQVKSKKKRNFS